MAGGRRETILQAALECFNERGFAAATVEEIRRRSGASIGSIYHHFGGKEGIAAELYVEGLRGYQEGFLRALGSGDGSEAASDRAKAPPDGAEARADGAEAGAEAGNDRAEAGADGAEAGADRAEAGIRALVRHHLRWVEHNPELARFLMNRREIELIDVTEARVRELNRSFFPRVAAWVDRWVEAGALRPLSADLREPVLLGPCQEFSRLWLAGRTRISRRRAEGELADATWNAVRAG